MTMQFDPLSRRISVQTSDKFFSCTPEQLMALDSDLADAARLAMSEPTRVVTVNAHQKRSSMAAYRKAA